MAWTLSPCLKRYSFRASDRLSSFVSSSESVPYCTANQLPATTGNPECVLLWEIILESACPEQDFQSRPDNSTGPVATAIRRRLGCIERHRHQAVRVLKDVIGHCADGTPARMSFDGSAALETAWRSRRTGTPISTLGYATALARANSGFASRAVGTNEDTKAKRAKRRTKARKLRQGAVRGEVLTFAVGNNVGVEKSRKYFRINDLLPLVRSEGGRISCDFNGLPRSFTA
jgi:hypothetical protein